jgi:hypothetical protein
MPHQVERLLRTEYTKKKKKVLLPQGGRKIADIVNTPTRLCHFHGAQEE